MVYLHGSAASRLFRGARAHEVEICMTVTFVDGLVVARSTYNTDINYRSVVIIGPACEVKDLDEKRAGLDLMVDHIIPGAAATPAPRPRRSCAAPCCSASPSASPRPRSAPAGRRRGGGLRPPHLGRRDPVHDHHGPAVVDPDLRVDATVRRTWRYRRPAAATTMATVAASATNGGPRRRLRGAPAVCGVVGLLLRDRELEPQLGALLVPMIEALDERDPDSRASPSTATRRPTRVRARTRRPGSGSPGRRRAGRLDGGGLRLLDLCGTGADLQRFGAGLVVDVPEEALGRRARVARGRVAARCACSGRARNVRVLKDTGPPTDTCARYGIGLGGYQAVAHTRMATESAVTVLHSHPFVPPRTSASCTTAPSPTTPPSAAASRPTGSASTRTTTPRWRPASWPHAWVRRRPRGGDPLGHEGDGRLLHPRHHEADEHVGGARRLRLQAGRGGRDRRATSPWPRSTGPWPSSRVSPTPTSSNPNPRRCTRGAAELCTTWRREGSISDAACALSAGQDRQRPCHAPGGRHNLAVGLTAAISITVDGNAGYFLGGLGGARRRHRARTSWSTASSDGRWVRT